MDALEIRIDAVDARLGRRFLRGFLTPRLLFLPALLFLALALPFLLRWS